MFFSYNRLLYRFRIKKQNNKNKYKNFKCSVSLRQKRGKKRTFYTFSGSYKKASLTIEAAMVFSIFILACWLILYGFKITELQAKVQYALNVTAEEMAAYSDIKSNTSATALFLVNLKSCGGDASMVSGTWTGFNLGKSQIQKNNSMIYLKVNYKIKIPQLLGIKFTVPCVQSVCTRAFQGISLVDQDKGRVVYITTGQTVYHTNRNCSYLNLSIQKISEQDFENNSGLQKKYTVCSACRKKQRYGYVYITEDGTRYHNNLSCKNLKRTIERVLLEDVSDRKICSRCSKYVG